jgi:hypothetical protein
MAIKCEITGKPFKLISQEIAFYEKMNLPHPRLHPFERHQRRMKVATNFRLFDRECEKCKKQIKTTYAPDRPEKVYCEECYLKEVY